MNNECLTARVLFSPVYMEREAEDDKQKYGWMKEDLERSGSNVLLKSHRRPETDGRKREIRKVLDP